MIDTITGISSRFIVEIGLLLTALIVLIREFLASDGSGQILAGKTMRRSLIGQNVYRRA